MYAVGNREIVQAENAESDIFYHKPRVREFLPNCTCAQSHQQYHTLLGSLELCKDAFPLIE
jgi:hypothetical protein